ncbi:hypothetical protein PYJP_18980 [Pyrofollis japonicus]|uniref:hypothetical protein n=1 Tax=Pyrofollis japonicus TaxID=3060460 RepID=UPI00295BD4CE|nr:hypothetical protein [Pyrofollis japonicus]BEP18546.1 hypothetical protein PYJP_18980 [Pyrofollis japonicus]
MQRSIIIVYHKPGTPEEALPIIRKLTHMVEDALGLRVIAKTIESVEYIDCEESIETYLLLPTRGGHWLELVEKGCNPKTPPKYLIASIIVRELAKKHRQRPLLVFLKSKRAQILQSHDATMINEFVKLHGYETQTQTLLRTTDDIKPSNADIIVPLAMLPGRFTENAQRTARLYGIESLGAMLSYGFQDIATWIIETGKE